MATYEAETYQIGGAGRVQVPPTTGRFFAGRAEFSVANDAGGVQLQDGDVVLLARIPRNHVIMGGRFYTPTGAVTTADNFAHFGSGASSSVLRHSLDYDGAGSALSNVASANFGYLSADQRRVSPQNFAGITDHYDEEYDLVFEFEAGTGLFAGFMFVDYYGVIYTN